MSAVEKSERAAPGTPRVSVLMSVYNAERYLREAIESILAQTLDDFEFIIVEDGSTDWSKQIIAEYAQRDVRVLPVWNVSNLGLTKSLNRGLDKARGVYIARQDADDRSLPERLQKQAAFLDAHPEVGLVGSWFMRMTEAGQPLHVIETPVADQAIRLKLFTRGNAFAHGSVMFRRECVEKVGGYREQFSYAEDYDLWLRIADRYGVANLPEPLYWWRSTASSKSVLGRDLQDGEVALALELARERREHGQDRIQRGENVGPANVDLKNLRVDRKTLAENFRVWGVDYYKRRCYWEAFRFLSRAVMRDPLRMELWRLTAGAALRGLTKPRTKGK